MLLTVIIIIAIIIIIFCVVPIEMLQNNLVNNVEFVANAGCPTGDTSLAAVTAEQQTVMFNRLMQVFDRFLSAETSQQTQTPSN